MHTEKEAEFFTWIRNDFSVLTHTLYLAIFIVAAGWFVSGNAIAQSTATRHIFELDPALQPAGLADWGDWWIDTTGQAVVGDLHTRSAIRWAPTSPGASYSLHPNEVLWIRLAIPAADDSKRWFMTIPNSGLDRVTLFTRELSGAWSAIHAGDRVPVSQWPMPYRFPVFPLAVSAADPSYYFVRIESLEVFSVPIVFEDERGLGMTQQRAAMVLGVYFGLLVSVSLLTVLVSMLERSFARLSFSVWVMLVLLAVASAQGAAGMYLWPNAPSWNDAAEHVLYTASLACLLFFMRTALALQHRMKRYDRLLLALMAILLVLTVALCWIPAQFRHGITAVAGICVMLAVAYPLVWVSRHGEPIGWWLLGALLPLALAGVFAVARTLRWIQYQAWVNFILPAAAGVTLVSIFLILTARAQGERDRKRRLAQFDQVDPTTGLVNESVFLRRLESTIQRSLRLKQQSLVIVIELSQYSQISQMHGRRTVQKLVAGVAARLASLTRPVDTLARLGEDRFGIIFEGPIPSSRGKLASMATRILTQCLHAHVGLAAGLNAKPRLALVLAPLEAANVDEVLAMVDQLMTSTPADSTRSIYMSEQL